MFPRQQESLKSTGSIYIVSKIVDHSPHQSVENIQTAKDRCNADVVIFPGGCTSIIQPMDKCINKPFKQSVQASWQAWMSEDRRQETSNNHRDKM